MMITSYKQLHVIEFKNITLAETTKIINELNKDDLWMYFILKETDEAIIGFPANFSNVYKFIQEQNVWGGDFYPEFVLELFFKTNEDAVQFKLTYLER